MKCLVRKLQASVNNPDLPIFTDVVLKSYITTTENGQYIHIPGIPCKFNDTKLEVVFVPMVASGNIPVTGISANQYIQRNNGYVRAVNTSEGTLQSIAANVEVTASFDSSDGSFMINGVSGVCGNPSAQTTINDQFMVFATQNRLGSVAGAIRIKSVKVTCYNGDIYQLVPAIVDGVACLYDADRGNYYGEKNGGTLLCG